MYEFLDFISNPNIAIILLIFAMVGLVVEIFSPGFGIGGIISIISFSLFFLSNIVTQNSDWYAILVFLIGIGLIFFEILVPGFGVAGVSGIIALIAGVVMAMGSIEVAFRSISVAMGISAILIYFIFKKSKKSKFIQKSQLLKSHKSEEGYLSVDNSDLKVGDVAKTATVLKPTGFIIINNKRYEAISEDGFIDKGVKVEVSRIEGFKNFVRRFND